MAKVVGQSSEPISEAIRSIAGGFLISWLSPIMGSHLTEGTSICIMRVFTALFLRCKLLACHASSMPRQCKAESRTLDMYQLLNLEGVTCFIICN